MDLALSLLQLGLLLWDGFDPWARNLHMLWACPLQKKKKKSLVTIQKVPPPQDLKSNIVICYSGIYIFI